MADGLVARAVAWIVLFDVFAHSKIKSGDLPMADSAAAPVLPDVGSFGWVQDGDNKYFAMCHKTVPENGEAALLYMNGSRKTVQAQYVQTETWQSDGDVPKGWSGVLAVSLAPELLQAGTVYVANTKRLLLGQQVWRWLILSFFCSYSAQPPA